MFCDRLVSGRSSLANAASGISAAASKADGTSSVSIQVVRGEPELRPSAELMAQTNGLHATDRTQLASDRDSSSHAVLAQQQDIFFRD